MDHLWLTTVLQTQELNWDSPCRSYFWKLPSQQEETHTQVCTLIFLWSTCFLSLLSQKTRGLSWLSIFSKMTGLRRETEGGRVRADRAPVILMPTLSGSGEQCFTVPSLYECKRVCECMYICITCVRLCVWPALSAYVQRSDCVCLAGPHWTPNPERISLRATWKPGYNFVLMCVCVYVCVCACDWWSGSSLAVQNSHLRGLGRGESSHVTQILQSRGLDHECVCWGDEQQTQKENRRRESRLSFSILSLLCNETDKTKSLAISGTAHKSLCPNTEAGRCRREIKHRVDTRVQADSSRWATPLLCEPQRRH